MTRRAPRAGRDGYTHNFVRCDRAILGSWLLLLSRNVLRPFTFHVTKYQQQYVHCGRPRPTGLTGACRPRRFRPKHGPRPACDRHGQSGTESPFARRRAAHRERSSVADEFRFRVCGTRMGESAACGPSRFALQSRGESALRTLRNRPPAREIRAPTKSANLRVGTSMALGVPFGPSQYRTCGRPSALGAPGWRESRQAKKSTSRCVAIDPQPPCSSIRC